MLLNICSPHICTFPSYLVHFYTSVIYGLMKRLGVTVKVVRVSLLTQGQRQDLCLKPDEAQLWFSISTCHSGAAIGSSLSDTQ